MGYSPPNDIDPEVRRLIRHKACRLVGRCRPSGFDRQDLEQELALHAISKQSCFDPARGSPKAFYEQLLRRKAASIVRAATAAKRNRHRIDLTSDVEQLPAREKGDLALQLDVRLALAGMPPDLRAVATLLMKHGQSEVARRVGLSRQQVRTECKRIAEHLRELGPKKLSHRQPTVAASAYVPSSGDVVADDARQPTSQTLPRSRSEGSCGPGPVVEDAPCGP